jgi:hypothetical protein
MWRLGATERPYKAYCIVLRCPDHAEIQYLERIPIPGMRIRDYQDREWVVAEAVQSGRETYTVSCVGRGEYQKGLLDARDLADDLLKLARRSIDGAAEQRRRWKNRNYFP